MTKRMLIDATHAEETRVVVLDGNRLEDFDVETSTKRQLKGNIYLAKVVRVEPSLQAAFVEYGGNRHGFLAFGEIHPDYYQIPVADRQRLIEMQAEEARREEEEEDLGSRGAEHGRRPVRRTDARPHRGGRRRTRREACGSRCRGRARLRLPQATAEAAGDDGSASRHAVGRAARPDRTPTSCGRTGRSRQPRPSAPAAMQPTRAIEIDGRARPTHRRISTRLDAVASADDSEPANCPSKHAAAGNGRRRQRQRRGSARAPHCRRASCATTRSRRSSSAGRSCWCRWSRRSAAPRARR